MNADKILGKKLLFITAHPDDESYLAAGTIYRNCQKKGENFLICITHGGQGRSHLIKSVSQKHLKRMRVDELKKQQNF